MRCRFNKGRAAESKALAAFRVCIEFLFIFVMVFNTTFSAWDIDADLWCVEGCVCVCVCGRAVLLCSLNEDSAEPRCYLMLMYQTAQVHMMQSQPLSCLISCLSETAPLYHASFLISAHAFRARPWPGFQTLLHVDHLGTPTYPSTLPGPSHTHQSTKSRC